MNCYITLLKICSKPIKPKLELETQNSNAADISKNFFHFIGSVVVRDFQSEERLLSKITLPQYYAHKLINKSLQVYDYAPFGWSR